MAAILESNFATDTELTEALASFGIEPPKPEEVQPEVAPVVETEPGGPGDKVAAEPEGKPEPKTEKGKKESQEVTTEGETEAEKKKSKGGFQRSIELKTAQIESLKEELDEERSDKVKTKAKLAELEAQLAELTAGKPKEDTKAPAELVEPKRPKRSEHDFDEEAYETAMDKYDADLKAYHKAFADKAIQSGLEAHRQSQEAEANQRLAEQQVATFNGRINAEKADLEDYDELLAALPDSYKHSLIDLSEHARAYVLVKSKHPAHLIHYFAADHVHGKDAENKRFLSLDAMDQIAELRELENRLIAEKTKAPAKPDKDGESKDGKPEAKAKTPEVVPPAKPKPPAQRTPEAPIEPLGGRTSADPGNLDKQIRDASARSDGGIEYRRLRKLQIEAARKAG